MNKRIAGMAGLGFLTVALLIGMVGAQGTPSSSGACHGAFANTNGNFGFLGTTGVALNIGGGVPAGPGAAGYDNSAVSGDCTLPSGQ